MREIKFRAWDKENKKMIYKSNVHTEGVCLEITLEGKIYDEAYGRHDSDGILNDKYVLMQYTGLKTENVTEIYEGDIIQLEKDVAVKYKTVPTHYEVNAMGGGTEIVYGTTQVPVYEKQNVNCVVKTANDGHYYLYGSNKQVNAYGNIVVGNIHENPELLEATQ